MKISELKERKIVTKDGYFMPLVFADLPAAACVVLVKQAGTQITTKIKEKDFIQPRCIFNKYMFFTPINGETMIKDELILSTNDIKF